jgi:hypothetical protein
MAKRHFVPKHAAEVSANLTADEQNEMLAVVEGMLARLDLFHPDRAVETGRDRPGRDEGEFASTILWNDARLHQLMRTSYIKNRRKNPPALAEYGDSYHCRTIMWPICETLWRAGFRWKDIVRVDWNHQELRQYFDDLLVWARIQR